MFNFWHSGALALRTERQSARMPKIKNGGLDQCGAEPFEQQQFGTAGVEGVKRLRMQRYSASVCPVRTLNLWIPWRSLRFLFLWRRYIFGNARVWKSLSRSRSRSKWYKHNWVHTLVDRLWLKGDFVLFYFILPLFLCVETSFVFVFVSVFVTFMFDV